LKRVDPGTCNLGIPDAKDEAVLKETVIASSERVSDEREGIAREPEKVGLEETMVISPGSREEKGPIPSPQKDEKALAETLILSPGEEPSMPLREPSQGSPPEEKQDSQEKASIEPETAEKEMGRKRQKKQEDFLTETVFIRPGDRGEPDRDKKK